MKTIILLIIASIIQVNSVDWVSPGTTNGKTTIVTTGVTVDVPFRLFPHNQPPNNVVGVSCGYEVFCYFNLTGGSSYAYEMYISGTSSANITVSGAESGSQPQIGIAIYGGDVLDTFDLNEGVNLDINFIVASNTYPAQTLIYVFVNGTADTEFIFTQYKSLTSVGITLDIAHPTRRSWTEWVKSFF